MNRLSGDLPNSFSSIPNLNILEGNLFSCSSFRRGQKNYNVNNQILNKSGYQCGSFMFNASISVYGSILLVIITIYIFSSTAKDSYRKLGTTFLLLLQQQLLLLLILQLILTMTIILQLVVSRTHHK